MTLQNVIAVVTVLLSVVTVVAALRKGRNDERRTVAGGVADRLSRLERKTRILDDYCNALRTKLRDAGIEVPDWPEELTEGGV